MIFGFNTEVKYGDTVYHIQSEARQRDQLLQTQVFIKGRCVGKHTSSYSERASSDFTDEHLHELLKQQHKGFVVAAREGRIQEMIDGHPPKHEGGPVALPAPPPVAAPEPPPVAAEPEPQPPAEPEPVPAAAPSSPKSADDSDVLDLS